MWTSWKSVVSPPSTTYSPAKQGSGKEERGKGGKAEVGRKSKGGKGKLACFCMPPSTLLAIQARITLSTLASSVPDKLELPSVRKR